MQWTASACFICFSIKLEVGIEKQESWGDTRLEDGTAEMQKVKGVRESGVCIVNEDSMEVADDPWTHPLCVVFFNPFLSLFPNLQTGWTVCTVFRTINFGVSLIRT